MSGAKKLREELMKASEPKWVREMRCHFNRSGTFPAKDVLRLLGDPNKRVEVATQEKMIVSLLSKH